MLLEEPNYITAIKQLNPDDFEQNFSILINELTAITNQYIKNYPEWYYYEE